MTEFLTYIQQHHNVSKAATATRIPSSTAYDIYHRFESHHTSVEDFVENHLDDRTNKASAIGNDGEQRVLQQFHEQYLDKQRACHNNDLLLLMQREQQHQHHQQQHHNHTLRSHPLQLLQTQRAVTKFKKKHHLSSGRTKKLKSKALVDNDENNEIKNDEIADYHDEVLHATENYDPSLIINADET